jgi:hypothetical protein
MLHVTFSKQAVHLQIQFVPHTTQFILVIKTNQLMLYGEMIFFVLRTIQNILCGDGITFLNVKPFGTPGGFEGLNIRIFLQ